MKRHALFVGVNDYADPTIKNLVYSSEDAMELASVFRRQLKFDRVEKLINPKHSPEVVDAVKDLVRGLGPGDLFLFFFAGHGFRVKENHVLVCAKDEFADLEDEYAGLSVGRLKKWMRGRWNRMLVLDACQNDIRATRGADTGVTGRDLAYIHATDESDPDLGCQIVVTSCSERQTALEVADLKHGLFTSALLDSVTSFANAQKCLDIETLRTDLGGRMCGLIRKYHLLGRQEPYFTMPTNASSIVLLDGSKAETETDKTSGKDIQPPPPPRPKKSTPSHDVAISNWTVELNVDLPGCDEKTLTFSLFETLSRYLCLLQGLGKHDGDGGETAFGSEAFRMSAWNALSGSGESAVIKCPSLTEEDKKAIAKAGGMEKLARSKRVGSLLRELKMELSELKKDLRKHCGRDPSVKHAFALVSDMDVCLKNEGEK